MKLQVCDSVSHVYKETNYTLRNGIPVICQCGMTELRFFAYQDITRGDDPLVLQEFCVQKRTPEIEPVNVVRLWVED